MSLKRFILPWMQFNLYDFSLKKTTKHQRFEFVIVEYILCLAVSHRIIGINEFCIFICKQNSELEPNLIVIFLNNISLTFS